MAPEKASEVYTLVHGTGSPDPSLRALSGLKVGPHQGPAPFCVGACLSPAAWHPGYMCQGKPKGQCQAALSNSSASLLCSSVPKVWAGARGSMILVCQHCPKHVHTQQAATAPATTPGPTPNLAPRSEQVSRVGRSQAVGAEDTSKPSSSWGFLLCAQDCRDAWL